MSFEQRGRMPLDYQPVALPGSVLRFRGPMAIGQGPSVVCIGGSETFGRFIHAPFPSQLADALPLPVQNLGVINAGLDVMASDPAIGAALEAADAVVIQVTSVHNMTNRFYSVHPRRNDRFLKASPMLRTIYPQVDFTEFHFTRHLLKHLSTTSQDRFEIVKTELQSAWVGRMHKIIAGIAAPVHLLWLSNRAPDEAESADLSIDPLFVTSDMLRKVADRAASLTITTPDEEEQGVTARGKFFGPREEAAARLLPGPNLHDRAAQALLTHLSPP
ncbi:DUF6473 family protein [Hasllibacter sp. MH4015]|uniref:DUF6473 family protein n=1 Tax=Hasllibacter sp. MH4015 TaxID=2854029 RepID=UPI001CD237DA|nr:DUF6473 family protein [Hasllibacter sp. MH4015]